MLYSAQYSLEPPPDRRGGEIQNILTVQYHLLRSLHLLHLLRLRKLAACGLLTLGTCRSCHSYRSAGLCGGRKIEAMQSATAYRAVGDFPAQLPRSFIIAASSCFLVLFREQSEMQTLATVSYRCFPMLVPLTPRHTDKFRSSIELPSSCCFLMRCWKVEPVKLALADLLAACVAAVRLAAPQLPRQCIHSTSRAHLIIFREQSRAVVHLTLLAVLHWL